MPLHVPVPAVALEGDYSEWPIYDTQEDTDLGGMTEHDAYAVFNTEETEALFVFSGGFAKSYDVATKTLGASLLTPLLFGEADFAGPYLVSVRGRYRVFVSSDHNEIYICKDGALIQTYTAADLGVTGQQLRSVSISRSGKYIVVVADELGIAPWTDETWVILEGS